MKRDTRVKELLLSEAAKIGEKRPTEWVAQKLGISSQAVQAWLSGKSIPNAVDLIALADLLGVHPRELIPPSDEKPSAA